MLAKTLSGEKVGWGVVCALVPTLFGAVAVNVSSIFIIYSVAKESAKLLSIVLR